MPTGVIINGADGRMGRALQRLLPDFSSLHLVAGVEISSAFPAVVDPPVVVIDFSQPAGFSRALDWCVQHRVALLSGTTGLSEAQHQAMVEAAASIPLLWSSNMSRGINVVAAALPLLARSLDPQTDVEILETHHAAKIDAPSGTALSLASVVAHARGQTDTAISANASRQGRRQRGEIGVAVRRGGDIAGEHTVSFYWPGECIEITHRATSRDIFALGALHVAGWIADRGPAQYQMADVVESLGAQA